MTARPLGSSDPKGINMTVQSENEMADLFVMRLVVYFRRQPKRLGIYYVQRVQSGMEAIDPRLHVLRRQHRTGRKIDRKEDVTYFRSHTGTSDSHATGYVGSECFALELLGYAVVRFC